MKIQEVIKSYLAARELCEMHAATLTRRAVAFAQWCGTIEAGKIFTPDNLNGYLASLERAPSTIRGYRGDLLVLWRWAADHEAADWPVARRIRLPRVPAPLVECYTIEEAMALVGACGPLDGRYGETPRSVWWEAIIRVAWDTGLRRSDLWRIKSEQLRKDGLLVTVQHKTGQRVYHTLHKSTCQAVQKLKKRGLLFEFPLSPWSFGQHFRAIAEYSVGRGTFKWLRRSSGSYVEAQETGAGLRHLGHSTPSTFYRHYDASAITVSKRPRPPELMAG